MGPFPTPERFCRVFQAAAVQHFDYGRASVVIAHCPEFLYNSHRGYELVKVLKERRDHPVLPNDPIHPINRRGRKNFCKEERKFKENPKINI